MNACHQSNFKRQKHIDTLIHSSKFEMILTARLLFLIYFSAGDLQRMFQILCYFTIFPSENGYLICFTKFLEWSFWNKHRGGHQPSGLGLPSTFKTSAWVGFCPKALKTSPHCAYVIFISDLGVRSKSENASLNSGRQKDKKKCMPCSHRLSQREPRPSP